MPYRFTCRSCFEYIYLETVSDLDTNYECSHCQSSNFINEKWHKLENIDQTTFAEKPSRDKAEMLRIKKDKKLNQSPEPHSVTNLGIISLLIFFISFFLPFYNLGSNGVTLWYILTEVPNNDLIGIFVLFAGGILLVANVDMNVTKTATIIGVCFPLYRFYKIVSVGDIGSSYLQPSFGIGGYLILIGAGIQLYACFSSTKEYGTIEKNIAEPQEGANLKEDENISNTESTDNENSTEDITEKIEKLSNLKDKGALTEEEFDTKKKEFLDRI